MLFLININFERQIIRLCFEVILETRYKKKVQFFHPVINSSVMKSLPISWVVLFALCTNYLFAQQLSMSVLHAPSTETQQCYFIHIKTPMTPDNINITGNGTLTSCPNDDSCPATICYDRPTSGSSTDWIECEIQLGGTSFRDGCTVIIWPGFAPEAPSICANLGLVTECHFMNTCDPCEVSPSEISHVTLGIFNNNNSFQYIGQTGIGNIYWMDHDHNLLHDGAWENYSSELAFVRAELFVTGGVAFDCGMEVDISCQQPTFRAVSAINTSAVRNYPNPASEETTIAFELEYSAPVSVAITNQTGQLVRVIMENQLLEKGEHQLHLDATMLSSGIYFYTIVAGPYVGTFKMNIIK